MYFDSSFCTLIDTVGHPPPPFEEPFRNQRNIDLRIRSIKHVCPQILAWVALHTYLNIVTNVSDCRRGFGLEIGFIGHLNIWRMATVNYSAVADLRTLQITRAHAKYLQSAVSFIRCSLVTVSNSGDSLTAPTKSSLQRLPYNSLSASTYWLSGWRPFRPKLLVLSSQDDFQLRFRVRVTLWLAAYR
jgi:hypothetical protein